MVSGMTPLGIRMILHACALVVATAAHGAESRSPAEPDAVAGFGASHVLMAKLQRYVHEQGVEITQLNADAMVRLMLNWYRFGAVKSMDGDTSGDALVYRYGGWSEGCATAFKLSLLRRVTEHTGAQSVERFAGITLMFEPSNQAELVPFSAVSSDTESMDAFLRTIEMSPAFKQLAGATPMGVLIETGGVR